MKEDEPSFNAIKIKIESNKDIVINENNLKDNYFLKKSKNNFMFLNNIKIVLVLFYFPLIIWSESLYSNYLFEISIPFQEKIQKEEKYKILLKICKILSIFGKDKFYLFLFGIVFLLMPLNYSFLVLQSIVYSNYCTNTLKMIYQSDRPNWRSEYLTFSCNYGYGNPSGHSFASICLYLSLAHIFVTYYKIKGKLKNVIFILLILFSFLIISSRFILAAHSLDQVLYGLTLGLGLYFILIYIIGYHKYSSIDFFQHIRNKKVYNIYIYFHTLLFIFTILVYFKSDTKDHSDLEKSIFNGVRCKIKNPISKYKNDALFQSLCIVSLIGAQYGINLLFKILKNNNYIINFSIIEWNKSDIKKFMLRIPVVLFSSIAIILYFIIPKNFPLLMIFILKSGVPFFLGMLGINFIGIYLCIYLKFANSEIYKMDVVLQEIFSDL